VKEFRIVEQRALGLLVERQGRGRVRWCGGIPSRFNPASQVAGGIGMRGGAVFHIRAVSAGVRP
jgi:hypothetical protein